MCDIPQAFVFSCSNHFKNWLKVHWEGSPDTGSNWLLINLMKILTMLNVIHWD